MAPLPSGGGRPSLLIFDCDGVLVDSEKLADRALSRMLRELGLEMSEAEVRRSFVGMAMPDCYAEIGRLTGRPVPDDWIARLDALDHELYQRELEPVPGVRDLLEAVHGHGMPRCVASSSALDKMHVKLAVTGLAPYFAREALFSAQMVERAKPHPDVFLLAAGRMGHAPPRCVVIEDSARGVQGAVAAGMAVIGYAGDPLTDADALMAAGAAHVVEDMAEAAALIGL
jgi:HAD superfamily hydrolase (TIGR01509 family)